MNLSEFIEDLVAREKKSLPFIHRVILFILWVLSLVYGSIVFVRNQAYFRRLLPRKKLSVSVISIGNILVGGAGKTPTVLFLVDLLSRKGLRPAILTRGYKVKADIDKDRICTVSPRTSPSEAGDEPVLLARRLPGIPVLVGRNRYQSGCLGISKFNPDMFVMDDGFQHLSLKRDLDIVVIDASRPLVQPLLPRGYLREPVSNLSRADGFLLTRIDQASKKQVEDVERYLTGKYPRKKIFHASYRPLGLILYHEWLENTYYYAHARLKNNKSVSLQNLSGKKAGLFAGVASPSSVAKTLSDLGICVINTLKLIDHQPITGEQLFGFFQDSRDKGAEILVTTEKDAVKLDEKIPLILPLYVILIELNLLEGEEGFYSWMRNKVPLIGGS